MAVIRNSWVASGCLALFWVICADSVRADELIFAGGAGFSGRASCERSDRGGTVVIAGAAAGTGG